jgi:hypothetical protein
MFASRTTSAQWAARYFHSTEIDAAGAIYVIGGYGGGITDYRDVWASTVYAQEAHKAAVLQGY